MRSDVLLDTLSLFLSRYSTTVSKETLTAGLPVALGNESPDLLTFSQANTLFSRSAKRSGYKTTLIQRELSSILELHLPMILLLAHGQSCILEEFSEDRKKVKVVYSGDTSIEEWVEVEALSQEYLGYAFLLKKEMKKEEHNNFVNKQHTKHWFLGYFKLSLPIYKDVLLASLLCKPFCVGFSFVYYECLR